ncbi:MAG: hypothetical protein WC785_02605 [Tatlockia sp.]|jgi:hypothetical protein
MPNKQFSERLNKELDAIEAPLRIDERVEVFAKLIKIPKFKADALLNGATLPDQLLLDKIAAEFQVNPDWLLGKSEERHNKTS